MSDATQKRSYKDTINAPQTAFPMKANLVQNEPATQKRWAEQKLYQRIREARKGSPRYVFHDGPPYANGSIHLGHLLNKVLKDIVVRSRTMAGFDCPYIPGWDCHGLPIEHKVVAELGDKAREMEAFQIRRKCQAYAEKFVKLQSGQMQRLLTLADYDNPYLTMHPAYEAESLEVFAQLVEKGLVYRALKPVHWSIANRTALADAELEYEDRVDTSIYVRFPIVPSGSSFEGSPEESLIQILCGSDLLIWTTTPWTLPSNLAVAVNSRAEYGVYRTNARSLVIATDLAMRVLPLGGIAISDPILTFTGQQLINSLVCYKHPFINRTSPVVAAEYVTLEDGTGLVHTAPGHGVEDYQTALRENLHSDLPLRRRVYTGRHRDPKAPTDIYCPVKEDGTFDETAPEFLRAPGVDVWKANDLVIARLRESGHLFHAHKFTHSYPHDWRSKTPTIFRATEQWFVGVDMAIAIADTAQTAERPLAPGSAGGGTGSGEVSPPQRDAGSPPAEPGAKEKNRLGNGSLRQRAVAATERDIAFFPDWGKNRLRGMLESRPDWCISRQRAWGLPIPAFFNDKGETLLTPASVRAVKEIVARHGSDAWFKLTARELLASYNPETDPHAPAWIQSEIKNQKSEIHKGSDIFDVWFDSGTSWASVIRQRFGADHLPTDLYLEGSDQHRGWFQASLLPAVATTGRPPYKAVLTHGFMVDKDGKKMSKSLGNALEVETLLKDHGADVCRWWVSSINTDNDIKVDPAFFKLAGEEYRKVRNTIKYLLSNLYDYNPTPTHSHAWAPTSIDAWVLAELDKLIATVRKGYDEFQFPVAQKAIFNFCNETLSSVYLAATKDRMYCDKADSPRRRQTQAAMHALADALIRLIAPVLPHTADEAWTHLRGKDAQSVHLLTFPEPIGVAASEDWSRVMTERHHALKAIEDARSSRGIDNPLDCGIVARTGSALFEKFSTTDLADLLGVSRFAVTKTDGEAVAYEVNDLRNEPRCERSWKRDGTVKPRSDGGTLSDRDAAALGVN